jgi:hypothetical protein
MRRCGSSKGRELPTQVREAVACWEREHQKRVLGMAHAENALATLFWEGCDPIDVLDLLNLYCQPRNSPDFRKNPEEIERRVAKSARRLFADAEELKAVNWHPGGVDPKLPSCMKKAAEHLQSCYESWMGRQPILPRGMVVGYLESAVRLVERITSAPHYPELSCLAEHLRPPESGGHKLCVDAVHLQKNVKNFRRRGQCLYLSDEDVQTRIMWARKKWDKLRRSLQKQPSE